jgi:hypothetical protein
MDWLDAAMEEYKTLRQEVQTSISAQQSILSFGTATLGFVFGAGVNLWTRSVAPIVVFSVLVPLLSGLILLIWWAEAIRMIRAGNYLSILEQDIAAAGRATSGWNDVQPLRWESGLRHDDRLSFRRFVLAWPEVFLIGLLIALTSLVIAFVNDLHPDGSLRVLTLVFSSVALGFLASVGLSAWLRWRGARREYACVKERHEKARPQLATLPPVGSQ